MNRFAIMVVVAAAAMSPLPALAYGALAIGDPPDVVHSGFAYGVSHNKPTADAASDEALNGCRTTTEAPDSARSLCTIVTTFQNRCAAISMDPAAGTPGVGWAVADSLADAEQQALNNCKATAGEARKSFCEVSSWRCDGQ